jgi:hypothetical protein
MNRFLYAEANPTTFIDPTGNFVPENDGDQSNPCKYKGDAGCGATATTSTSKVQPPKPKPDPEPEDEGVTTVHATQTELDLMDSSELRQYLESYSSKYHTPSILDFDFMYAKCRYAQLDAALCYDYAHQRDWQDLDGPVMIVIAAGAGVFVASAPELALLLTQAAARLKDQVGQSASPWLLNWIDRGRSIESLLGHNLPQNYPTFDRYVNGVATSIKSIDLSANAYQSMQRLSTTLTSHVDAAANGVLRNWGSAQLAGQPITGRILQVAIPNVSVAQGQVQVMAATVAYGASKGVTVQFVVIP